MKKVFLIGAGQLGSRHLQALKKVSAPLSITVIDPSEESLQVAKTRYRDTPPGVSEHVILYEKKFPEDTSTIDFAIIATNSNVRFSVLSKLLQGREVKYILLEKLLFDHEKDYDQALDLIQRTGARAFINCPMRIMPYYKTLREEFTDKCLQYTVTGSQIRLITNSIQYIDHLSFLTGSTDFVLDCSLLDINPTPSKRNGFLEFEGTLIARFKNGSLLTMTSYPNGEAPPVIEIRNKEYFTISREAEQIAWHAGLSTGWAWSEVAAPIPYQSQMTTQIAEQILFDGRCDLTPIDQSIKLHMQLLSPLLAHLNQNSQLKYDYYPFT